MGVDIVSWRSRIGSFNAKMLKISGNIAHFMEISLLILMAISIAVMIETVLIIGGVELNTGPETNEKLLINCTECGLIWNANQVGLIGYNQSDLTNSKFVRKSCILEKKVKGLLTRLNHVSIGLCFKINKLKEEMANLKQNINPSTVPLNSNKAQENSSTSTIATEVLQILRSNEKEEERGRSIVINGLYDDFDYENDEISLITEVCNNELGIENLS